jgi:hypothetical protein
MNFRIAEALNRTGWATTSGPDDKLSRLVQFGILKTVRLAALTYKFRAFGRI